MAHPKRMNTTSQAAEWPIQSTKGQASQTEPMSKPREWTQPWFMPAQQQAQPDSRVVNPLNQIAVQPNRASWAQATTAHKRSQRSQPAG